MIIKEEKIMNKAKTAKSLLLLAAFSSMLLLPGCSADKYSDGKKTHHHAPVQARSGKSI